MIIPIKISVIIVNYNVREFLLHSIQSIVRALSEITHEIIVVDNASVDGSVQAVEKKFPEVKIIANTKNLGFSAANNQAIKSSLGEYIVLINPDTVVQEDTFSKLLEFMDSNQDAGGATCKILNPDGTFSIDSRHSIPTPSTALWKLIGFNRLFPKSKTFGRYNLTYLDPNETYTVDAISGSFMFLRKKAVDDVGLLDEDYFMYCEDVDYCYRMNKQKWKIYYVPESNVVHYKGESTKKSNIDYIINFNKSLYLFYKKHFHEKSVAALRWIILFGVMFRGALIYSKNAFKKYLPNLLDITILNLIIFLTFYVRFEIKSHFSIQSFFEQYVNINLLTTIIFILVSFFYDLYRRYKSSFSQVIKTNFVTFFIVSAATFFLRELAFSRLIVVISAVITPLIMILWRVIGMKKILGVENTLFNKKTLLVGTDDESKQILKKLKSDLESSYDICGLVTNNVDDIGNEVEGIFVVTHLDDLHKYARMEKITHIIFSSHNISYEKILKTMSEMTDLQADFKIVPEKMDVMIGKSSVEILDKYPLIDFDNSIGKSYNILTKRIFDIFISFPYLILTFPFWSTYPLFKKQNLKKYEINGLKEKKQFIYQISSKPFKGFINFSYQMLSVFLGKMSIVGSPVINSNILDNLKYFKPGITGILQINRKRINDVSDAKRYNLYYLKNQSIWMDLKIIYRSLFN